ncbi:hypothetical protein C8R43DRAFT_1135877 [Mycena crocata]|nr:hypothetical protein C8R43DRAFT_1135877 [Mycena crocata]
MLRAVVQTSGVAIAVGTPRYLGANNTNFFLDASTSVGPAQVHLYPEFEGSYDLRTSIMRARVQEDRDVEDPARTPPKRPPTTNINKYRTPLLRPRPRVPAALSGLSKPWDMQIYMGPAYVCMSHAWLDIFEPWDMLGSFRTGAASTGLGFRSPPLFYVSDVVRRVDNARRIV